MSNVRAIRQALSNKMTAWHGPCIVSIQPGNAEQAGREGPVMSTEIHPVDQMLPAPRLLALGLQHVLVMYAGAVTVPLIIGRALKLPPEDVAFLISADLFACGLATLVQCIGFPGVGIRLPVMMGVTFASVGPMLSMAAAPDIGLLGMAQSSLPESSASLPRLSSAGYCRCFRLS
jgi:Permease family